MKKGTLLLIGLLVSTLTLQSCGVMFGGSRYNGNIVVKDHPNAEIYANGQKMGTGEITSLFARNKTLQVEVKQEGCEPKTVNFDKRFRTGNFILSAITWGLIGIGVDLGTGSSYKPDHVNNTNVEKLSDKNYRFNVDYSECKK